MLPAVEKMEWHRRDNSNVNKIFKVCLKQNLLYQKNAVFSFGYKVFCNDRGKELSNQGYLKIAKMRSLFGGRTVQYTTV